MGGRGVVESGGEELLREWEGEGLLRMGWRGVVESGRKRGC